MHTDFIVFLLLHPLFHLFGTACWFIFGMHYKIKNQENEKKITSMNLLVQEERSYYLKKLLKIIQTYEDLSFNTDDKLDYSIRITLELKDSFTEYAKTTNNFCNVLTNEFCVMNSKNNEIISSLQEIQKDKDPTSTKTPNNWDAIKDAFSPATRVSVNERD